MGSVLHCNHCANTELLTSSGGRARCGPARTTPAATCCLLHRKLPTARWASFARYRTLLPSMERTGMRVIEVAGRIGPCRATGVGVVSERDVCTGHCTPAVRMGASPCLSNVLPDARLPCKHSYLRRLASPGRCCDMLPTMYWSCQLRCTSRRITLGPSIPPLCCTCHLHTA
jgi:hypothetical protein